MWQMTGSKATSGESRCGKWQLQAVIQNARQTKKKNHPCHQLQKIDYLCKRQLNKEKET
jgi:hypothetical protein